MKKNRGGDRNSRERRSRRAQRDAKYYHAAMGAEAVTMRRAEKAHDKRRKPDGRDYDDD
jgi:hypothetical protein